MINLSLRNRTFSENEKWPLLYVIPDIYLRESSFDTPLSDLDVVEIAKRDYGLRIERRTVAKYRLYLTEHFGFSFGTRNKGHFVSNRKTMLRKELHGDRLPELFSNYDVPELDETMSRKALAIEKSLRMKRELRIVIPYYLTVLSKLTLKVEDVHQVTTRRREFLVTPMRLFQFNRELYLIAYCPAERQHYIFLVRSALRMTCCKTPTKPAPEFDLDKYMKGQEFIITGPIVTESKNAFKYVRGSWIDEDASQCAPVLYTQACGNKKVPHPYMYQTLADLFGLEPEIDGIYATDDGNPYLVIVFPASGMNDAIATHFDLCEIGD